MIRLKDPQGSAGWLQARAGIVTASEFHNVLTKGGKPSQGKSYLARLVAETLLGGPIDTEQSGFMERGTQMEAEAVAFFEFDQGVSTQAVGLCLRDDRRLGASPDRLVGKDGGLEIKCPSLAVHVANLIDPEAFAADHRTQVQTGMLVTERPRWWLMSYHPTLPKLIVPFTADPEWQKSAKAALVDFLARMDTALASLAAKGAVPPTPVAPPAPDQSWQKPRAPLSLADAETVARAELGAAWDDRDALAAHLAPLRLTLATHAPNEDVRTMPLDRLRAIKVASCR